jgi:hypothetical protein
MPDPLDYREPATSDAPKPASPTRNAMGVGVAVFVVCLAAMFLPLAIPLGQLAKFLVAIAFVGACVGLSITANALIDWWRGL